MFPTFAEVVTQLASFAALPAAFGVLCAAGVIVVIPDWRASVFALGCQSVLAGILFSLVLNPQVAGVKVIVGLLVCVQIFLTARQIDSAQRAAAPTLIVERPDHGDADEAATPDQSPFNNIPVGAPFRLVAVFMIVIVAWQLAQNTELTVIGVPFEVSLATFGLAGLGLLGLGLNEEPLKVGMLLLTVLMGFEMYYASIEPALAVMALLAVVDFAVALGVCYLAAIRQTQGVA